MGDNLLKSLICFVSVRWFAEGQEAIIIMLASGLMVLPFIILSPLAGYFSKKVNKQKIVVWLKIAEIVIMSLAVIGFYYENIYIVLTAMLLMGTQSTLFSPLKFALVRDIGGIEKSSIGTGTVEMTTFFGVLIGTFIAGILSDLAKYFVLFTALVFILNSLIGLIFSFKIKAIEGKALTVQILPLNFVKFIIRKYKWANKTSPGLNTVVMGLSMFWLVASLIQLNIFRHCNDYLNLSGTQTGIILAIVAIAIGAGSFLSGYFAKETVKASFIPLGGIGFIISIFSIYIFKPQAIGFTILIFVSAFTAGFFKTPLNAWMQVKVKGRQLGDAIAYNNLINFIFILLSAGIFGFVETNYGSNMVFLIVGFLSIIMISYLCFRMFELKELFRNVWTRINKTKS